MSAQVDTFAQLREDAKAMPARLRFACAGCGTNGVCDPEDEEGVRRRHDLERCKRPALRAWLTGREG